MMSSMFVSFEPTSMLFYKYNTMFIMNWCSMLLFLCVYPKSMWLNISRLKYMLNKMIFMLVYSFISLLKKNSLSQIVFIGLFMLIFMMNTMGLIPYIFTSTSHLTLNMALAMLMWMSIMLYFMLKNMYTLLMHLIPMSTPLFLSPFMVLIESISMLIRPFTLMIRLTANICAGHLLITLLSNSINTILFTPLIYLIMIMLLILELAVSFIQAYVFYMLSILYMSELK
uniref:ATP synthase subunit a n=1 Tax=Arisubathynella cheongmiensis TaxID=2025387 RepID=A0A7R6D7Q4_9CRUS|nr:ATP synthase F0 subunit 6 [Arisubathynella cheongmiensis]